MNKYVLRMKTISGLGTEYVYVYANDNFERYLNNHNLKYARYIKEDYHLISFNKLQQENQQLKEEIQELKADYGNKAQVERDLLQLRIDKAIEILHSINEDLPITLILEEIEHSEYILKGEDNEKNKDKR